MDPDAEVTFEFVPVIRQYKSGRVERLHPIKPVPPSVDSATGVASKDVTLDPATGLWARLYLPADPDDLPARRPGGGTDTDSDRRRLPIVLYFHGGGLVVGSAADAPEHAFVTRLAARAGALAVSVEYGLAPEHPVPACYDDAWAALRWVVTPATAADPWVRDHGDVARVFVLGFSAGGNIAHNLTLRAGSEPDLLPRGARVQGMALLHPFLLSPAGPGGEVAKHAWVRGKLAEMWAFACGEGRAEAGPDNPRVNPLADGAPSLRRLGCGRVLVCLADDALVAEGKAYYDALLANGWDAADVELLDSAPADHEFHLREPDSAKAVLLMDRLVALITGN
jgi:acetyl esterase/lipase